MRRSRRHRELPLPRSFKRQRGEHWLDRHERQVEDHEEALRKRMAEARDEDLHSPT